MTQSILPPGKLASLLEKYFTSEEFERAVDLGLSKSVERFTMDNTDLHTVIRKTLQRLEEKDAGKLYQALQRVNPSADFKTDFDALAAGGASYSGEVEPYDQLLVQDLPPVAVVDRKAVRAHARSLFAKQGYRVLSVTGPTASGKSYTWELLQRIAREKEVIYQKIDLAGYEGQLSVEAFLIDVVLVLGCSADEWKKCISDKPTPQQIALRFVRWLGPQTQEFKKPKLLVFDSLDRQPAADVRDLVVGRLLEAIGEGNIENLLLVLLGDNGSRVAIAAGKVLHDDLSPLTAQDIHEFLGALAKEKGWALTDANQAQFAKWIVRDLRFPFDHSSLTEISKRLGKVVEELAKPPADADVPAAAQV